MRRLRVRDRQVRRVIVRVIGANPDITSLPRVGLDPEPGTYAVWGVTQEEGGWEGEKLNSVLGGVLS